MFSFIDLFAGIGGFRIALEKAGGKCVAFSEIDKKAISIYSQNFNTDHEVSLGDITKCTELPKTDLIVGGVPCQAWSIAGKNKGFSDERGKLWFDAIKSIKLAKPKAFIFENVKGLQDPRNIGSLNLIIEELEKLDYKVSVRVLNASDYGLPQNRERLFLVGIKKDLKLKKEFSFPAPQPKTVKLADLLDNVKLGSETSNKEYFIFCDTRNGDSVIHSWDLVKTSKEEKRICLLILNNRRKSKYGNKDGNPISFKDLKDLDPGLKMNTLKSLITKRILKKVGNKFDLQNSKNSSGINDIYRIYMPNSKNFSTLTATGTKDFIALETLKKSESTIEDFIKNIVDNKKYRQISSREAGRLQGFPESFNHHPDYKSAIKQFGNAVPVNMVYALIQELKKTGCFT